MKQSSHYADPVNPTFDIEVTQIHLTRSMHLQTEHLKGNFAKNFSNFSNFKNFLLTL